MKKFIQLFILLIISGFISSLFVARALDKKESNYLHKINLRNIYRETILYGTGEGDIVMYVDCNFELVTDSKDEITSLNDLKNYFEKHLIKENGSEYYLINATGTISSDGNSASIKAFSYVKNDGFFFEIEPTGEDIIITGPFMEFVLIENDINEDMNLYSDLIIKDNVSKSKEKCTESKSFLDFIDSNDSSNENANPVFNG